MKSLRAVASAGPFVLPDGNHAAPVMDGQMGGGLLTDCCPGLTGSWSERLK
jgi:hypothetical protein